MARVQNSANERGTLLKFKVETIRKLRHFKNVDENRILST